MDYLEIKFKLPEAFRDIIIAELSDRGFDTFMETDEGFNTYVDRPEFNLTPIDAVVTEYQELCTISYETTTFPDKNWNEEWEKNFEPIVVADKCHIRAPFHPHDERYPFEILIEPKMAFGTGHHATTYLMVAQMLENDFTGKRVLDLGCGTGILSIAAVKLGATEVWATDINQWSIDNSQNNFNLNQCDQIQLHCGQIDELEIPGKFEVVLANINRNVLLEEMHAYCEKMTETGLLMLSGFYDEDRHLIEGEAIANKLSVVAEAHRNNWCLLVCKPH